MFHALRDLIVRLRDDLDLQAKTARAGHSILAQASLRWEMLTESNSRGFCAPTERFPKNLDAIWIQLAKN